MHRGGDPVFISGAECDRCGRIAFFEGKRDKMIVFTALEIEGWKIKRKNGNRPEQSVCPSCIEKGAKK